MGQKRTSRPTRTRSRISRKAASVIAPYGPVRSQPGTNGTVHVQFPEGNSPSFGELLEHHADQAQRQRRITGALIDNTVTYGVM